MSARWNRIIALVPRAAIVVHDLFVVWACWQLLHAGRYSILPDAPALPLWNVDTSLVLGIQALVFWRVGLYRGLWRFASVADLINIFKASFIGLVAIVLTLMWKRFDGVPMSVLV
ncbi:MAG: polysaccharide biosynthesis protein, partial [Stenotrophomonas sp.]|nr:polysaccharide biosynthesis protein [Stenotrophomonas sp.]